jgi:hypothetical protein
MWTIRPPRLEEVPFVIDRPSDLRRDIDDAVAPQERESGPRAHLLRDDLLGARQHEVQVLVESVEDSAKRASALQFDEHPLVQVLLKDLERLHEGGGETSLAV